jgi:light-regulated signal transduction histidine kinase (bacteriophytochrome)
MRGVDVGGAGLRPANWPTTDLDLFDIAVHMSDDQVVIEAEPSQEGAQGGSPVSIRSMMARLDQAETMEAFFREGARQARASPDSTA